MSYPDSRLQFVRLDAGYHLAKIIDMEPADAGAYFKKLLTAILIGRVGVMPEADEMILEAQEYHRVKREAGRKGGIETQRHAHYASSNASSSASSNASPSAQAIQTDRQTDSIEPTHTAREGIPTLADVQTHATIIGMPEPDAREFFEFWQGAEWKDAKGLPVRNWKAKLASRKNQIAERKAENANIQRNAGRNNIAGTQPGRVTATGKGKW